MQNLPSLTKSRPNEYFKNVQIVPYIYGPRKKAVKLHPSAKIYNLLLFSI